MALLQNDHHGKPAPEAPAAPAPRPQAKTLAQLGISEQVAQILLLACPTDVLH